VLYLVHHADAVSPAVDSTRPLSERGLHDAEDVAARAAARGARPKTIWHSGKLRARQTAEIYWKALNPAATFTAMHGLQPDDDPEPMADTLEVAPDDDLMIVGHFPYMPALLSQLLRADAVFPQHGIVALEKREKEWVERWREPITT
jgi:phosphohistidine phosphatase